MENTEEIFHFLEDFSKRKPKTIPQELNEYLAYVARTGDPVYQWSLVKSLFKEKLLNVITDFYETTPGIEIPPYPNVDPFNYDIMKNSLLERLDSFTSAPFTVQRLCELLTFPRKQYNRIDKFMRAIEKNILVVSTREPGIQRHSETENGEANEPIVNGSDNNSEYNVDVEMEDMSWKDNIVQHVSEPQPGSSDTHISVDDIEARLKAKENTPMDSQQKKTAQYEAVTPPELNVTTDDSSDIKTKDLSPTNSKTEEMEDKVETSTVAPVLAEEDKIVEINTENKVVEMNTETKVVEMNTENKVVEMNTENKVVEMNTENKVVEINIDCPATLVIPEIRVDDVEMTEQKLTEQSNTEKPVETEPDTPCSETKPTSETPQVMDENSSDSKDESETKLTSEILTSSEESSSSDNTDGSCSPPKTDEGHVDLQEESNLSGSTADTPIDIVEKETLPTKPDEITKIESENYSISDVQSELSQPPVVAENIVEKEVTKEPEVTEETNKVTENVEDTSETETTVS